MKHSTSANSTRVARKGAPTRTSTARATAATAKGSATKKTAKKPTAKKITASPKSERERAFALLNGFSTVMLLTPEGAGARATMRARPMHVAQLDDDCTLTFLTSVETSKVEEAAGGAGAMVVAQSATRFASITGRTEVVRDQARIHAAWSPADKVYFPKGKDDPNLCLVVFHPQEAELWDTAGANGLRFLFDAARALLTGAAPKHDAETHARVSLGTA